MSSAGYNLIFNHWRARTLSGDVGSVTAEKLSGLIRHRGRRLPERSPVVPTIALLPLGDVFEDFLDTIGVSLDEFFTEMTGTWIFGYVEALDHFGVRTVLILWSREARRPHRRVHVPTGTAVWVLPASRAHRTARRLTDVLGRSGRWARHLRSAASLLRYYTATTPRSLARALRQERCEAMLVQEYENPRFDVCVLLGRWLGLPVLASFQGGPGPSRFRLKRWARSQTVRAAAGLLIGSRQEAEAVAQHYRLPPGAITLVPNPINAREWTPGNQKAARAALGLPANVPVACWQGRVEIETKGLDILVEAWRLVCGERPEVDLRLLMCGSGTGSTRLRSLLAAAGVRGVHWRDEFVSDRAIVHRQLAAADVFALPSRAEGFAVAPMEAMACGRPVVASDVHGVADLLAGGEEATAGGVMVPSSAPRALATALGRLLDDRVLAARLGKVARRRIEEHYSLEAVGLTLATALHRAKPERFPSPS
jgi:glycosyltransferase involved in cell wall biosynthesis